MGKLALAAKITHVPSMYLSELDGLVGWASSPTDAALLGAPGPAPGGHYQFDDAADDHQHRLINGGGASAPHHHRHHQQLADPFAHPPHSAHLRSAPHISSHSRDTRALHELPHAPGRTALHLPRLRFSFLFCCYRISMR